MANESLDLVGWAIGNAGSVSAVPNNQFYMPMMAGSRLLEAPELYPAYLAQGLTDAAAWTQGVKKPALVIRTPVFGGDGTHTNSTTTNWFNTARLAGALVPNTTTGIIATDFCSKLQFRFADNANDAGFREFSNCKLASLTLSWGGEAPVIAEMLLVAYGTPTWSGTGSGTSGTGTPNVGPYFMSQGVKYNSTLSDVVSGSLSILTGLVPDLTTPMASANAPDTTTGVSLPNNYFNAGPPVCSLQLVQKKGAATVVDPADETMGGTMTVEFFDVSGNAHTSFSLTSLKPVPGRSVNMGLALVSRSYRSIQPSAGTAAYSIA